MKKTDLEWLHYWRDSAAAQYEFINCVRAVLRLDPLPSGGPGKGRKGPQ
jgi:hypothetical protein